ncbi:MAG: hypothetical protein ACRCUX_07225 [Beijerinckiaceae bacterium]
MAVLLVTIILYGAAALLLFIAYRKNRRMPKVAALRTWREFMRLLPRLAIGIIGAGFLARMVPADVVTGWLGKESGITGIAIATLAGALTPGGPVVGYSLGAAALKAGAGVPQVMAYVTGWSLYTFNRMIVWELPTMPAWFVRARVLVSLPFPFIIAFLFAWMT